MLQRIPRRAAENAEKGNHNILWSLGWRPQFLLGMRGKLCAGVDPIFHPLAGDPPKTVRGVLLQNALVSRAIGKDEFCEPRCLSGSACSAAPRATFFHSLHAAAWRRASLCVLPQIAAFLVFTAGPWVVSEGGGSAEKNYDLRIYSTIFQGKNLRKR